MKPRPCPVLKHHKKLGLAYVEYRVRGTRRYRYFGPWGSRSAAVKYAAWARRWPRPLQLFPTTRTWPAVRLYTFEGRTQSLARWAAEVGMGASALRRRLDVLGWTFEEALTAPRYTRSANAA